MHPSESATTGAPLAVAEADIRQCCTRFLAASLKRPAELIDPNTTFARLGVDSATSVFLLLELEERLGVELPPDIVFDYPTIARLARYIATNRTGDAAPVSGT